MYKVYVSMLQHHSAIKLNSIYHICCIWQQKDQNGKYKLVEKDRDQQVVNVEQKLTIEELAARVAKLEAIVIDPRPQKRTYLKN
jgi:hypothetical protein